MNWTPSNWVTETFKPKDDSGWHLAASMTIESENEESLLLRDKEKGWPTPPPGPTRAVATVVAGRDALRIELFT